ncbi:hypothetical protein HAX54_042836 [Datura stramonium]|uniref:Uncharacterized protein n=1 Tax=Datura stramonium TaxID=4076 RepID=A0ABS8W3R4_DATST|nr:hypothetical protein [Datura stramonium]
MCYSPDDSVDKVVTKHGEELVGCRIRVWWPLDQVFYEGHITLFDHSEKKHVVIYEDGDQEMLNLSKEHWELIDNENASDPIQEIVPGPTDLSDMCLDCITDPYQHIRKKKKVRVLVRKLFLPMSYTSLFRSLFKIT